MKASIDGQGYYADSIEISESLPLEEFTALGTKKSYVVPVNKPEGSISISFYITSGTEISNITNQYAKYNLSTIQAGPYVINDAILNSFSIQGDATSMIKGSVSYNYYSQMSTGSTPSKSTVEIIPAHGAASQGSLSQFGGSALIDFNYSFNQSFNVDYVLESGNAKTISFGGATESLELSSLVDDFDFAGTSLTGESGLCKDEAGGPGGEGFFERSGNIQIKNLCDQNVHELSIVGILDERSVSSSSDGDVMQSVKITKKFVEDAGCS